MRNRQQNGDSAIAILLSCFNRMAAHVDIESGMVTRTSPSTLNATIFNNLFGTQGHTHDLLFDLEQHYGSIVRIDLAYQPFVVLTRSEYAQYVLVDHSPNFRPAMGFGPIHSVAGLGLLNSEESDWWRWQTGAEFAFQIRFFEAYCASLPSLTEGLFRQWRSVAPTNMAIDVWPGLLELHYQFLSRVFFGVSLGSKTDPVRAALDTLNEIAGQQLEMLRPQRGGIPTVQARYFQQALVALNEFTLGLIRARQPNQPDTDVLSNLIRASVKDPVRPWTEDEIQNEILSLFLTMYENTANALFWTLSVLTQNSAIAQKVQAELFTVAPNNLIRFDQLNQLTILKEIIRNSLRLYPPNWGRLCKAVTDDEIDGYHIPAGTTVFLPTQLLQKQATEAGSNQGVLPVPLITSNETDPTRRNCHSFGSGRHSNVVARFAFTEVQYVLALLLQHFRLALPPIAAAQSTVASSPPTEQGFRLMLHAITAGDVG